MITLHQTIKVPADCRITVELPETAYPGSTVDMTVTISATKRITGKALARYVGVFKNSATFAHDALGIQNELRSE